MKIKNTLYRCFVSTNIFVVDVSTYIVDDVEQQTILMIALFQKVREEHFYINNKVLCSEKNIHQWYGGNVPIEK